MPSVVIVSIWSGRSFKLASVLDSHCLRWTAQQPRLPAPARSRGSVPLQGPPLPAVRERRLPASRRKASSASRCAAVPPCPCHPRHFMSSRRHLILSHHQKGERRTVRYFGRRREKEHLHITFITVYRYVCSILLLVMDVPILLGLIG